MTLRTIKWLSLLTVMSFLTVGAVGGLSPWISPDTGGYFERKPFPSSLGGERTPVYGWLIDLLTLGASSFTFVPTLHLLLFSASVWLLIASLQRFGLSETATISLAATLLFSNATLLLTTWVHPELLAISCAICGMASIVVLASERRTAGSWPYLGVMMGGGLAYLMRPSFLPFVVLAPIIYVALRGVTGYPVVGRRALTIALAAALPFVAVSSMRALTVKDFNIVSFGGFNMMGMAALMLDDAVVARLPPDTQPDATYVLRIREQGERNGTFIGIPPNSTGSRSFVSVALGYYDVLVRTHDDLLHGVVRKLQKPGESWVDFNQRMMRLATAVVLAAPHKYLAWVSGATSRVVGRVIVTNAPMALSIVGLLLVWPALVLLKGSFELSALDFKVLVILAILWLLCTQGLTVLVTIPAARYIDTSALFVAGPVAYLLVAMVAGLRSALRRKFEIEDGEARHRAAEILS